jgi:hypothetical protein
MDKDIVSAIVLAALLGAYFVLGRKRGPSEQVLGTLASTVSRMRALAQRDPQYLPVPGDGRAPMAGSEYYDAASKEIAAAGCRVLGDRVEEMPEGTVTAPSRWFADESGTVCGWFGVVAAPNARVVRQAMYLFSEAQRGDFYITGRGGANAGTAGPPTQHQAECRWADGLARQLEVHRAQIPADAVTTLTHVATIDDAMALTGRMRQAKRAWRAQQPADALLDQDLRQILQDRYSTFGAALAAYMKSAGLAG